jgi:hypothetical protein
LAFLEAQAFRESFGDLTPVVRKSPPAAPTILPPSPRKRRRPLGAMGTVMAMAASFLLALGLFDWALQGSRNIGSPANNQIVGGPRATTVPAVNATNPDALPRTMPSASTPWQMVKLQAPGLTGDDRPLQIPALPRPRLDDDYFRSVPSPLPDDVRQALERTGHEVRTYRELVPVHLKDGRQLVVPVDQVEVSFDPHQAN